MSEKENYRKDVDRKFALRVFLRRLPKRLAVLVVFGLVLAGLATYIADMPRERYAANFGFFERLWVGTEKVATMTRLTLEAHHEDLQNTPLPVVEVYIRGSRLDRLEDKLPETSGYEKADIRLDDKVYDARVRFRGDSLNHWAFPAKSWRIVLDDAKTFRGMRSFNLNVPRTESQLSNWLGYEMARQFGDLLVPYTDFVHFRLNRRFNGVRLLLEQPEQDFLRRRSLPYGKLYVGDIDTDQIYGGRRRERLYSETAGWEVKAPAEESAPTEIARLLNLIRTEHDPYRFYRTLPELVDIEELTKYMALLELVGSVHVDETHNGKFFAHPDTGRLHPIVWDTVAYFWGDKFGLDLGTNGLFRVVLSNPAFREKKDRYLHEAITGELSSEKLEELIVKQFKELQPDMYAFALKLHANDKGVRHISNEEWERAVRALIESVQLREKRVQEALADSSVDYRALFVDSDNPDSPTRRVRLAVQVGSRMGYKLETISLPLPEEIQGAFSLTRLGIEDTGPNLDSSKRTVVGEISGRELRFSLGDELLSKRRFTNPKVAELVPATYLYELEIPSSVDLSRITLSGVNSVTGDAGAVARWNEALEVPEQHQRNSVWWNPDRFQQREILTYSGRVALAEDVTIGRNQELMVEAGTTLLLAPGVSLYSRGGTVKMLGTAEQPIMIRSTDSTKTFGVIGIVEGEGHQIHHVKIQGGSSDRIDEIYFGGTLSFHESEGEVHNLVLTDGFVSVQGGRVEIRDSEIRNIFPFAVKSERAFVRELNLKHEMLTPGYSKALLKEEAFGTRSRVEREFKWRVGSPEQELDLYQVADGIRKALAESVADRSLWKAAQAVGNNFYIDDATEDFVFRDIYFDTEDSLNAKFDISHRLRNRFFSWKRYKEYEKNPTWPDLVPYRLEYQAKTGRSDKGQGYSVTNEARFEFRKESLPFSVDNLPPPRPWTLEQYMPYFLAGRFENYPLLPAQEIVKAYVANGVERESFSFVPKVALLTERFRKHLNIKSPYGSGPNPEQSFIISLDKSRVYDGSRYVQFMKERLDGYKSSERPPSLGAILEIEIEFERNVSDVLDRQIEEAAAEQDGERKKSLEQVRQAFLADQEQIMNVVQRAFAKKGIPVQPESKSKYIQAYEIAFGSFALEKVKMADDLQTASHQSS